MCLDERERGVGGKGVDLLLLPLEWSKLCFFTVDIKTSLNSFDP